MPARRVLSARAVAFAYALALVTGSACGHDTIELLPEAGPSVAVSDAPTGQAADQSTDLTLPAADGSRACVLPPARQCVDNGSACVVNAECCSLRCSDGTCLPPGTCNPQGVPCGYRSECCSGRCEPHTLHSTDGGEEFAVNECLPLCLPTGAGCRTHLDCCAMACHGGKCGGMPACFEGDGGVGSVSCQTAIEGATCRATGDLCSDGGLDAGGPCCTGICGASGRCEFGPGPCLPSGSICQQDSDCCRGTCAAGAGGVTVCAAPCLADGQSCSLGADCCGGYCNGTAGQCASSAPVCSLIGSACTSDAQCCSGQCIAGACGSNCAVP